MKKAKNEQTSEIVPPRVDKDTVKGKTVTIAIVDLPQDFAAAGAFCAPDSPGWDKLVVGINMTFLGAPYAGEPDEKEQKECFKATFADVLAHELFHVCQYIADKHLTEEQINGAIERGKGFKTETVDTTELIDAQIDQINKLRAENEHLRATLNHMQRRDASATNEG